MPAINFIGAGSGGFFDTGNFWAWVVSCILLVIAAWLVSRLFRILNGLVTLLLGALIDLAFARPLRSSLNSIALAGLLVIGGWLIGCIFLTGACLDYFAAHAELNSWLAEGGFLATVLVYLGIFGLLCPLRSKD